MYNDKMCAKAEHDTEEETEAERQELIYEEDGHSQALFKINEVGDHIEITFFEEGETLEFQTLLDLINADLSTFKEAERAQKRAREILED